MTAGYTFDPLDRGGILLGLTPVQLVALGAGAVLAGLVGHGVGGIGGGLLGIFLLAAAIAASCWPVRGRPVVAWVPVVAGWAGRRHAPVRGDPPPPTGLRQGRAVAAPPALPPGVALTEVDGGPDQAPVAGVRDRPAGTWIGALVVGGRTLPLLDRDDQRAHLASWGGLLAGLARPGSPIHRVQWIARVRPGERPGDRLHDVVVAVALRRRRGTSPTDVLGRELRLLAGQLATAGLDPRPPLDAAGWERSLAGTGTTARWPRATEEAWAVWRAGGEWHATYWIAEWPRVEVGPDFLTPVLLAGGCCRVALTMGGVPAARAARQIESARTASVADDELRRRAGFLATARRQRRSDGMARREAELADGHADYRFSGYVTVSGPDRATLDARCAEVEQVAQGAGLALDRLWGQQAEAFTWTLPLARGLR